MKKDNLPLIDIEKVIASKKSKLLKLLPKFVINYLKRIIHQEEINQFLIDNRDKKGISLLDETLSNFLEINYNVRGQENVPKNGRFIIASNHPLGGIDGMLLIKITHGFFKDVKFLVNDILLNIKPIEMFFAPVNKHGAQAKKTAIIIEETYQSDTQVLIFPAGLISRKKKGKVYDLEWKKSFISKAIKHQRDVIPVHISGGVSNSFYFLANLRKFLGIKFNIEMLYLVREMFKQRGKSITVTFGEPISYKIFDKTKNLKQWAEWVKQESYKLVRN